MGRVCIFSISLWLFHKRYEFSPFKYQQYGLLFISTSMHLHVFAYSVPQNMPVYIEIEMLLANPTVWSCVCFLLMKQNETLRWQQTLVKIVEKSCHQTMAVYPCTVCARHSEKGEMKCWKKDMFNESFLIALKRWEIIHQLAFYARHKSKTKAYKATHFDVSTWKKQKKMREREREWK